MITKATVSGNTAVARRAAGTATKAAGAATSGRTTGTATKAAGAATSGTPAKAVAKRRFRKIWRNCLKPLAIQALVISIGVLLLMFSLRPLAIGCKLFVISDNISLLEEYSSWSPADHEEYSALIAARGEIKESSTIGYLMVMAGAHPLTQMLRIIILLALVIMDICIAAMIFFIIRMDLKDIWEMIF